MTVTLPRLRQIALVAVDLEAACDAIESGVGLESPFHDPGVAEFGLTNAVYELGDTFLEVVSPAGPGTTAGRYLERKGGDAGYMALFQVADTVATRRRAAGAGLRTVWQIDLPDISGTHLHPRDVPGAIVSFDTPLHPASWRWGGPRWIDGCPDDVDVDRGIAGITLRLVDVEAGRRRWSAIVDLPLTSGQAIAFEPAATDADEGIVAVHVGIPGVDTTICGVRLVSAAG